MATGSNLLTSLLILRILAFLIYGYSVYYRNVNETLPPQLRDRPYGKWKFLTYWDLVLQFGFFGLAILASFRRSPRFLSRLSDFLFYSLAFPIAMFVCISFWALWSIDRELVFPKAYDAFYPWWLHQTSHTLVAILVVIELLFGQRDAPTSLFNGLFLVNLFSYAYALWVLFIALTHDIWVYPVLKKLNWPLRIGFGIALGLINSVFHIMAVSYAKRTIKKTTKTAKIKAR